MDRSQYAARCRRRDGSPLGHAISPGKERRRGAAAAAKLRHAGRKRSRMIVYPAIDLIGGKCVRLVQGDYDRMLTYDGDPVAVARRFREQGAEWLHIVDLDGAREGRPVHLKLVGQIVAATGLPARLGGGLRSV